MKKVRKLFSLAFIAVVAAMTSLLTACGDDSTIYLTVTSKDNSFKWWYILIIAVAVLAVIAVLVLIAASNRKKKRAAEEQEDTVVLTQDPNAVSEYYFDDEKAEAAPAEEAVAEENTEEPATEAMEEAPAEEAVTESEDAPAETEPEEIVEEVADASFAEEKADVVEEAVTEEAPAEEITEAETEKEPEYTIGANGLPIAPDGMVIRYKWSFLARLIRSDDELKFRYMKLRRKLLSYKKVRSSVSWNFDSYFIGRKPIVKLKVRGKTLVAYFPFDPQEMAGTKYVGEDFSGVARYKAVPFAYRINGARKLKYAFELIERQLEGIKSTEPVYLEESQVEEAIPTESFKKLFEKGYIRVGGVLAVGDRAPKNDDDDDDDAITVEEEAEVEAEFSELREEFNFNPKAQ